MVSAGSHAHDEEVVVDYKGRFPVNKSRTGGWLGAGLILGTELSERIVVMGVSMNMITYLVGDLHLASARSANIITNVMGTLNLLALVGGFLADAMLGRYQTVAIFGVITAAGASLLTVATSVPSFRPPVCNNPRLGNHMCVAANSDQLVILYVALYSIAVGAGGIKANVSGFGSDQFDLSDPREEEAMVFFFNRFYFCISLGSLFSVTVLVYIQDNVGRGWGYGISAAAMAAAVVVLLAGTRKYRYRWPQGSPLTLMAKVFAAAWRKRGLPLPADPRQLNESSTADVQPSGRLRLLDKAAIIDDSELESGSRGRGGGGSSSCCTVTQVEDVKAVLKLLPIWCTCILFWTVYSQMTTFGVEQATYMDRHIGSSFEYSPGSLSLFLFLSILIITALNEKILVPIGRALTGLPHGISSLQRAGVGLVFSIVAMVVAGLVERNRREHSLEGTKLSVFCLVPQYVLVGAGEAFAYVGQLEFFIREAPEQMKSLSTGLFLATLSMGFFFSSVLVTVVGKVSHDGWIKNNLDGARLDYFYWLLAVLGAINLVVFFVFAWRREYKTQSSDDRATRARSTAAAANADAGAEEVKGSNMQASSVFKSVDAVSRPLVRGSNRSNRSS